MIKNLVKKHPEFFIFTSSLFLFIFAQYSLGITGYNVRFPQFVAWMQHHGPSWLPNLEGGPYPDYPVTYFFLAYCFTLLFGQLSMVSMALPFCFAGAITLVFIYKLGCILDKKLAIYGVLFALLTWKFFDGINSMALDIFSMMATTIAVYFAYQTQQRIKVSDHIFLYLSFILGFLFRGPIGFIAPSFVVFLYFLSLKNWKKLLTYSLIAGVALALCCCIFALIAYLYGGQHFLHDVILFQAVDRIRSHHAPRYYFYFSVGLINYALTIFFAIAVVLMERKKTEQSNDCIVQFLKMLSIWFISILLLLTIPHTKKPRYILPIVPAISLLAAYIFYDDQKYTKIKTLLNYICFLFPFAGLITAVILQLLAISHNSIAISPYMAIISLTLLSTLNGYLKIKYKSFHRYQKMLLLIGGLSYIAINSYISVPYQIHQVILHHRKIFYLPFI